MGGIGTMLTASRKNKRRKRTEIAEKRNGTVESEDHRVVGEIIMFKKLRNITRKNWSLLSAPDMIKLYDINTMYETYLIIYYA